MNKKELLRLERQVKAGLRGFQKTMLSLKEIFDRQLYTLICDDWRDYLRQRFAEWGEKRRVNQLIAAFPIFANIANAGTVVPTSEAQVRVLASQPENVQRAAWDAAIQSSADGNPRAQDVRKALERLTDNEAAGEKLRRIQVEENRAKIGAQVENGQKAALAQAVRLLHRARKVLFRVGPAAEGMVKMIEAALAEAGTVEI
jgi:hypothetical protein